MNFDAPTYKVLLVGENHLKWQSLYHVRNSQKTLAFFEIHREKVGEENPKCDAVVKSNQVEVKDVIVSLTPENTIDDVLKTLHVLLSK